MKPQADPLGRSDVQRLSLDSHLDAAVSSHAGVRTSSAWLAAQIYERFHISSCSYLSTRRQFDFSVQEKIKMLVLGFKTHCNPKTVLLMPS